MPTTKLEISDDYRIAMNQAVSRGDDIEFITKNICRAIKTYVKRNRNLFGDQVAHIAVANLDEAITNLLINYYASDQELYMSYFSSKEQNAENESENESEAENE